MNTPDIREKVLIIWSKYALSPGAISIATDATIPPNIPEPRKSKPVRPIFSFFV